MTAPMTPAGPSQQPIPTPESTAEIHKVADTDSSSTAVHHTLGIQPNQASPGSHTHNGRDSKALNATHAAVASTLAQSIPAGAFTKLTMDTIIEDNEKLFDNANDLLILKTGGLYLVECGIRLPDALAQFTFGFGVGIQNPSDDFYFNWTRSTGNRTRFTTSHVTRYGPGNGIRAYVFFDTANDVSSRYLSVTKVGP